MISPMDYYWMKFTEDAAQGSLDESRKCGCVIIAPDAKNLSEVVLSVGVNNFPPPVKRLPERLVRPAKYTFTEHAERDAIYTAARIGYSLENSTAYLNWYPCADCARALVLSGITRLVCYEPNWEETRYGFHDARAILKESGLQVEYLGKKEEKEK